MDANNQRIGHGTGNDWARNSSSGEQFVTREPTKITENHSKYWLSCGKANVSRVSEESERIVRKQERNTGKPS